MGRRRTAGRARRPRSLPARRGGAAARRRRVPARHARGQSRRSVLPRPPHRPLGDGRGAPPLRHRGARVVHDLLHVDARNGTFGRGRRGTPGGGERRCHARRRGRRGDARLAPGCGAVKRASKLTVYFGESDRLDGHLLSDTLLDLFEQHRLRTAVLMRGVEGFGGKHGLRTDRLLTFSEDLPLVAVAVDEELRIDALLPVVRDLVVGGLVTLERAALLHGRLAGAGLPEELDEATKLTVYLGRDERVGRCPAFLEIVDRLHGLGVAGATVLLGVDGLAHGERRRAGFFSRND